MSQAEFIDGETCRFSVTLLDIDAAAADPGVLRLLVRDPSGTTTTYTYAADAEVVRSALGAFHADLQLAASGAWVYRWESDAPNPGAAEGTVTVTRSAL